MARQYAQAEVVDSVAADAEAPWALPVAESDDDWSGVIGGCHALRGPVAPVPGANEAQDWGYDVQAS